MRQGVCGSVGELVDRQGEYVCMYGQDSVGVDELVDRQGESFFLRQAAMVGEGRQTGCFSIFKEYVGELVDRASMSVCMRQGVCGGVDRVLVNVRQEWGCFQF